MQLYRDRHAGIGRSPVRRGAGVWEPTGELLVTTDVVYYVVEAGEEAYAPGDPGVLVGAPVEHAASGARVGEVLAYDHPVTTPAVVEPVVRCRVEDSAATRLRSWARTLTPEELEVGLRVRVEVDPPVIGEIVETGTDITYPEEDPHSVRVFVVRIGSSMTNRGQLGAAVSPDDGSDRLAGILLRAYLQPDGGTRFACRAAYRVLPEEGG